MTHHSRRRRRTLFAIVATGVAIAGSVLGFAAPAQAGWAGATGGTGCNAINMTNDRNVYFYNVNTDAMTTALTWSRETNLDPTDVNTYLTSNSSIADVIVYENPYTDYCGFDWYAGPKVGGIIGLTTCGSTLSNGRCNMHTIRLDSNYTNIVTWPSKHVLACHEMGHVIGLTHAGSNQTCMAPEENEADSENYSSVEIGWLNNAY